MIFPRRKVPRARNVIEQRALEAILERIRAESGSAPSVDLRYHLLRWERFIDEVEAGYLLSVQDYESDLMVRDAIEEIKKAVPVRLAREIALAVEPLDFRLRQVTSPSDRPILPGAGDPELFWWWRIPNRRGEELEADLRADGLV